MNTPMNDTIKRIEGVVSSALAKGPAVAHELERERSGGAEAAVTALGALFGALDFLKSALRSARGERLPQTDTFTLVDHWGRLTALATLLAEIEAKTESDGEAHRARIETFWRGISSATLNLARDIGVLHGLTRCAELSDWVLALSRAESEAVRGSIRRMVAR